MWCTRWFLPLLLLPLPTAPSLFLLLFLLVLGLHARPCFYCIVLLTAIFVSSCYWQPIPIDSPLSTPWATNITTFVEALNASMPPEHHDIQIPSVIRPLNRCWCDMTSDNVFEPFNVTHWEYLSVQRLKTDLIKRKTLQIAASQSLDGTDTNETAAEDLAEPSNETTTQSEAASQLDLLFPRRLFAHLLSPLANRPSDSSENVKSDNESDESQLDEETLHRAVALSKPLPFFRREYDMRRYGFDMIVDFGWSRES